MTTYRVTFTRSDSLGAAYFVRDYECRDAVAAHSLGLRDLMAAHPDIWESYVFRAAVLVDRIEGVPS